MAVFSTFFLSGKFAVPPTVIPSSRRTATILGPFMPLMDSSVARKFGIACLLKTLFNCLRFCLTLGWELMLRAARLFSLNTIWSASPLVWAILRETAGVNSAEPWKTYDACKLVLIRSTVRRVAWPSRCTSYKVVVLIPSTVPLKPSKAVRKPGRSPAYQPWFLAWFEVPFWGPWFAVLKQQQGDL